MSQMMGAARFGRAARGGMALALALACSVLLVAQPALAASGGNGNGNSAAAATHSNGKSAAAPGHNKGTSVSATPAAATASTSNGNGAAASSGAGNQGRHLAKGNPHNTATAAPAASPAASPAAPATAAGGASSAGTSTTASYATPTPGPLGSASNVAAHLVGLLPPSLGLALTLICPQLRFLPSDGCELQPNPIISNILGSSDGLRPFLVSPGSGSSWLTLPGLLLLLVGLAAARRRNPHGEQYRA